MGGTELLSHSTYVYIFVVYFAATVKPAYSATIGTAKTWQCRRADPMAGQSLQCRIRKGWPSERTDSTSAVSLWAGLTILSITMCQIHASLPCSNKYCSAATQVTSTTATTCLSHHAASADQMQSIYNDWGLLRIITQNSGSHLQIMVVLRSILAE